MTGGAVYLRTLQLYYEEEVEGEAYFAELALAFADPEHRHKLLLLAAVERHAAQGVAPLLEKYRLTPRPAAGLAGSGCAEARQTPADWDRLIAGMNQSYPGYLEQFRALEAMGPPEDQRLLSFLTEHEVAALEFLALEAENPALSAQPLLSYLQTSSETWDPGAG